MLENKQDPNNGSSVGSRITKYINIRNILTTFLSTFIHAVILTVCIVCVNTIDSVDVMPDLTQAMIISSYSLGLFIFTLFEDV